MFWLKILTKGIEKMSWIIAVVFIAIPYGEYLLYILYYIVASVSLWNFKNGESKLVRFLAKNQQTQRIFFKSVNFLCQKKISFKNINLGDHFLLKPFFF